LEGPRVVGKTWRRKACNNAWWKAEAARLEEKDPEQLYRGLADPVIEASQGLRMKVTLRFMMDDEVLTEDYDYVSK